MPIGVATANIAIMTPIFNNEAGASLLVKTIQRIYI